MFIPFTLAFIELLATEANAKDLDLFDLDVEQRQEAVLTLAWNSLLSLRLLPA